MTQPNLLALIATEIETDAGASTSANATEAGYWKRIALAAETLAGASTSANANQPGYMKRTAEALEALAAASTVANATEGGYEARMVLALETLGAPAEVGSWGYRLYLAITEYGQAPDAPVLTQTSDPGFNPMAWSSDYTSLIIDIDYIRCRWRIDGGAWTYETDVLYDSDFEMDYGIDGAAYPWPLFAAEPFATGQVIDVQEGILRNGVTAWSNTLSEEMLPGGLPIPQTDLALYVDASDTATLWQLIDGTTPVTADGQVVGRWDDLSSLDHHMAAASNGSTRPLYKTSGGYHWVEFDGTDDILRYMADLSMWNASGCTVAISMRSLSNGITKTLVGSASTASGNQFYNAVYSQNLAGNQANAANYIRNNSGVDVMASTLSNYTSAFDGSDRVIIMVDDGSGITIYKDGVAGTRRAYTRAGNSLTLNNVTLGGLLRTTVSNWFAGRVYGMAIWPGRALDATERGEVNTYFASLYGGTL